MKQVTKNSVLKAATLVFGCVALGGVAQAKVIIEPILIVGYEYSSNFWRAEDSDVAVDTYFIKPGVAASYDSGKSQISGDFFLEPYWYDDRDTPPPGVRDADEDDYVGFSGNLEAKTLLTDRITLSLTDSIYKTRDPAQSDDLSNSVERNKYIINRVTPKLYYDFGNKFGIDVRYTNTLTDYQEDDGGEDSDEHKGTTNLFYNFNRRSAAFVSYDIWERDYDGLTSTYVSNRVKLNYARQFNNFSVVAGGGYHNRSFDETGLDDIDAFSWSVAVKGQDPPAPDESPRAKMLVALTQDLNDAGSGEQYYLATRLDAMVGYVFMGKINTEIKGYYQNSDYENDPDGRDDDTYQISGLVGYQFWDYATLGLEVGHEQRDSNLEGKDYDETFAVLTLDLRFSTSR